MTDKQYSVGRSEMVPQLEVSSPGLAPSLHQDHRPTSHIPSGRSPANLVGSPRKRKLTLTEVAQLRRKLSENEGLRIVRTASRYAERCAVRCYLGGGGSPAEYPTWRNRLSPVPLISYLIANRLDAENPSEDLYSLLRSNTNTLLRNSPSISTQDGSPSSSHQAHQKRADGASPPRASGVATCSTTPSSSSHEKHHVKSPIRLPLSPYRNLSLSPVKTEITGEVSPSSNQEHIVERARQEANVMQRIAELQRSGLWSEKRIPKVQELPRPKSHWDYLLEEMVWLAADFAQEKMWKKAAAKKCAHMVQRYFKEKEQEVARESKAREMEKRRIAGIMAREVKLFWSDIEKLIIYKRKTISDERKKRALNHHLSFIRKSSNRLLKNDGNSTQSNINKIDSTDEIVALRKDNLLPLQDLLGSYLEIRDRLPGSPSEASDTSCDDEIPFNSIVTSDNDDGNSKDTELGSVKIDEESDDYDDEEEESYEESSGEDECQMDVDQTGISVKTESFDNILESARWIHPQGDTLPSVGVVNNVPFLLRRKLKEYQQVGFDWLVGLYEKKLNGILGDETSVGKMVQTIALLAHLACEKGNWGPHLIIVPTADVFLWETEIKKICPGLKILSYYGSLKERKSKRTGWTRPNSFHVCITSYKIIIEDHLSFRRKKWKFLILDEAQNLKNISSLRWQSLFNLRVQNKLLLTGKPIDENQIKSFVKFLLPKESVANFNENTNCDRLLRPLSLCRTKDEIEDQLPRKNEHLIKCNFSNRQRLLYDDFMKRDDTVRRLKSGRVVDILQVLIYLRKVCNHPDLIEDRPSIPCFQMDLIDYCIPSLVNSMMDYDPFNQIDLSSLNYLFINLESNLSAFVAHRARRYKTEKSFIEEIDNNSQQPQCPRKLGGIKISVQKKNSNTWNSKNTIKSTLVLGSPNNKISSTKIGTSPIVKAAVVQQNSTSQGVTLRLANPIGQIQNYLQIVGQQGKVTQTARLAHIVNTPAGKQILISPHQLISSQPSTVVTSSGQRVTVVSKQGVTQTSLRPLLRLPPLAVTSNPSILIGTTNITNVTSRIETPICDSIKLLNDTGSARDLKEKCVLNQTTDQVETAEIRRDKLNLLYRMNELRCMKLPVYGSDVISVLTLDDKFDDTNWLWTGSTLCHRAKSDRYHNFDYSLLNKTVLNGEERLDYTRNEYSKFTMNLPKVVAKKFNEKTSTDCKEFDNEINEFLSPLKDLLTPSHPLNYLFPDRRLLKFDCGKMEALNLLLRKLKRQRRKVIIFTQMIRMLDLLELFLNYYGYPYLRLGNNDRIDQIHSVTERFNVDQHMFCFIMSTRCGGMGLNLTSGDTVIFYDSDWNPSMEEQTWAMCQRINQHRDITFYRLITKNSIEENYSSRYIQKRFLSDLTKNGSDLNDCYFKTSTVEDLFDINVIELDTGNSSTLTRHSPRKSIDGTEEKEKCQRSTTFLERALAKVEDDVDVEAARISIEEVEAQLCEFDESHSSSESEDTDEGASKDELELEALEKELSGVERYAMKFIEEMNDDQLTLAESHWELAKRGWETTRWEAEREDLKRKRKDSLSDDEELTFSGMDARCTDWVTKFGLSMPLWAPPTPPQDDNDMYIDEALCLLYEPALIPEAQLPPVYTKKDRKRSRMEMNIINSRMQSSKIRHKEETLLHAPRSLFDRPTPAMVKMRQEMRLQRYRGLMRPALQSVLKPTLPVKPLPEPDHAPDWLIHEDWTILHAIQQIQEMTINLVVLSPGHTSNWDLVADLVNMSSRTYRSPKQCRNRYESVIMPREEGKPIPDSPKKLKKNKLLYKPPQVKSGRPVRTSQLFQLDNNSSMTQVMNLRFDAIRSVSARRAPTAKPLLVDPSMKVNPRLSETLGRGQHEFEKPLNPIEVAAKRADRIAREKQLAGINDQAQQALRQKLNAAVAAATPGTTTTTIPRQLTTMTVQEMVATVGGNRTVVSTSGIPVNRTVTAEVKAAGSAASSPSGTSSSPASPSTAVAAATSSAVAAKTATKTISATQLALYRQQQQALLRQQQQIKLLKAQQATGVAGSGTPSKVSIAVTQPQSPAGTTVTVPRMQQVVVKSGRAVTESDVVAMLKRQQATKVAAGGQAQTSATLTTAQILTSIQVKQLSLQQQLLAAAAAAHQRAGTKLGQQKVAQFSQVAAKAAGGGTQLIVQSGHKTIPTTVTVQHLQQVMKQVRPGHVVVAGPGRSTTIPGTVSLDGRQVLAGTLKTSQQAILTQVQAVLPSTSRGQTPLVSAPLITIPPTTSQSPSQSSSSSTDGSTSQQH